MKKNLDWILLFLCFCLLNIPLFGNTVHLDNSVENDACSVISEGATDSRCPILITGQGGTATCGENNGWIDITVDSSDPPFTFQWSNGSSDEDPTNLSAGDYCVTVTDAAGCSEVYCVTVDEPSAMAISLFINPVSGPGAADGSIEALVSGGIGPYDYQWNSGLNGSSIITGLPEGTYCVVVTDGNGCTITSCGEIQAYAGIVEISGPEELCVNECGTYTVFDPSGNQLCSVLWDFEGQVLSDQFSFDFCPQGVTSGGYLGAFVNDCSGNTFIEYYYINVISTYPLEIVSTSPAACPDNEDNASCDKTCANSTITYTVPGSQGLDLNWEVVGAESFQIDNNLLTVDWGNPGVGEISVSSGLQGGGLEVHCTPLSGAAQGFPGTGQVFAIGGTPPYNYQWCNGSDSDVVGILGNSPCSVTVTDATGNTGTCELFIPEMTQICGSGFGIVDFGITDVSCNGGSDGSISLVIGGTTGQTSYLWSNGDTSPFPSNLAADIYYVTVTNDFGCEYVYCFPVQEPDAMYLNAYMINPPDDTGSGSAGVQVFGGLPPYTYDWTNSGGGSGAVITNLPEGTYSVTVTDSNGCTATADVSVNNSINCLFSTYLSIEDLPTSCYSADAYIVAHPSSGGAPPYELVWTGNNGFTSTGSDLFLNGASGGNYCLEITDANGCVASDCVYLPCDSSIPSTCTGEGSLCIDIIPEPDAGIKSTPEATNGVVALCKGETMLLQNISTDADNYVWELGDGYSTSAEEVSYAYAESGTYTVLLIARNECFCIDTTTLTVAVSDSEIPEIICTGTTCANTEQTYTTTADCASFIWTLTANGTITDGGTPTDNFVTVNWGAGPTGEVSVQVFSCNGDYCDKPTTEVVPIIQDGTPITGPAKICPGEVSTYSLPLWTGTSYNWTVANGGEIKSGQFTNTITVKWNVPANVNDPLWVNAAYENCFLDCSGESHKEVELTPEFYLAGPIDACENSGSAYAAFDAVQNQTVSCDWVVKDPAGVEIWSATAVPSVDVPWPLMPGKYSLTSTPTDPTAFCNNEYTIYVNVNAGPPALTAIDGLNAICPGEFYTYSAVANQGNVSYFWEINNGGTLSENQGQTINVQWGLTQPYELTVWQLSNDGLACESLPFTMTIAPINDIGLAGPNDVCLESTETYTANEVGNATYDWSISPSDAGTLLSGQGGNSIEVLWHAVGVANISVALCGGSENIAVNVSGFPEPVVVHPSILCPTETDVVSTTESFATYSWRNENGDVISTVPTPNLGPGYYDLVVTNSTGCEGQSNFEIEEYPSPEVSISNPGFDFYCIAAGFPIPTLYALNTDGGYSYEWYQGGTALNVFTETYTPTGTGSYRVQIIDENGCVNFSNTIYIYESCGGGSGGGPPIPGAQCPDISNIFSTGDECRHGIFQNTSTGYVPGSIQWFFDDPASGANNTSTLENPEHFFTSAGFYNIVMIATSPSGATCAIYEPFEVRLQANFDDNNACPGLPTVFEDISTFTPGTTITDWEWSFGDPASGVNNTSTLEEPGHVYENIGDYDVTLTVTAQTGCTSTVTKTISVLSPPDGSFAAPTNSCEATALPLDAMLGSNVVSSSWDFGDPASGSANTAVSPNTFHAFSAPGIYNVTLNFTNVYGCSNTFTMPVNVDANGLGGEITMDPSSPICDGNSTTAMPPAGGTSWAWSTGPFTENIVIATAGVYNVTITDAFGCTYSPPDGVLDVIPNPEATIKVTEYNEFGQPADCFFDGYVLCEGEDVFLSISGAGDYNYIWSSGQSGSEVIYGEGHNSNLTEGTYNFTVTVTDNVSGCTNVEGPYTIIVNPVPTDINISTNPPGPICEGTEALFEVTNVDPDLTYLWNTGEYGTSITASTAGEYFVRGISQFGCEGESNTIEIYRSPDANLIPDGCHVHCAPDTICLPEMPAVVVYQWYLDDNLIPAPQGTVADLMPEESGSYRVELFDVNGCYAASDAFDLTLLPYSDDSLTLGACEDAEIVFAGEVLLPGSTTQFQFTNVWGCDSMITVTVTEDITYEFDDTIETCEGTMVEYNGIMYAPGATAILEYSTSFGCDSIINLEVLGWPSYALADTLYSCNGTTVFYQGVELFPGTTTEFPMSTFHGCDSTVTIVVIGNEIFDETVSLSACEGEMVMYNGTPYPTGTFEIFNYTTVAGCDSTITLSVSSNPVYSEVVALEACDGTQVQFAGVMLSAGVDTLFELTNQFGCDSMIQVVVTGIDDYEQTVALSACDGGMAMYEGTAYPVGTNEEFNFTSVQGCDSTIYLTVATLPIYVETEIYSACSGTLISYAGEELLAGSTNVFGFSTFAGCDSTVTVIVNEDLAYSEAVVMSACEGEMVMYNGNAYPAGTLEIFNYNTIAGCDSTITLSVASNPIFAEAVALETCNGTQVQFAGVLLGAGVDTLFELTNQFGCDSMIQVTVTEVDAYEQSVALSACEGGMAMYEGTAYPIGTNEEFNFTSVQGCDSTVYLSVAALPTYDLAESYNACTGTFFMYNGEALLAGSTQVFEFSTDAGCDSIVTVIVNEDLAYSETVEMSGCEGETVIYNGISYPTGTEQLFEYSSVSGCDSTILLSVAALPLSDFSVQLYACSGTTVEYVGDDLLAGNVYEYIFENQMGCDSVVEVSVGELSTSYETLGMAACEGSTVTYNGTDYEVGTQVDVDFTNMQGCDSIVALTVSALEVPITVIELDICANDSIAYENTFLQPGTTNEFIYEAANGCDSIVIISLIAYPAFDFALSATDILCWNDASGEIIISNINGGTEPFEYAVDDSAFQSDTLLPSISSGQHSVYVQDANGCIEEQVVSISEIPPLEVALLAPAMSCQDDSIVVQAQLLAGQTDSMYYDWQHGAVGTLISIYDPGTYNLAVTNSCETRDFDLEVNLGDREGDGYFYIPNSFSPNNDGVNDVFTAYAAGDIEVLKYELHLYDRWGNTLYETERIGAGWDGSFGEEMMNPGVYVWWMEAEVLVCGRRVVAVFEKGDVTIFR